MKKLPLALFLAMQLLATARGQGFNMELGVRSGIDVAEKARRDKDPAYAQQAHLRRYLLASIKEVKTDEKLVKPVNARAMAAELNKQLQAQGFRPVGPGEKPEIIITVLYARGMILNPYIDPDRLPIGDYRRGVRGPANLSNTTPLGIVTHDSFVGLEAKTQSLNYEKLAIRVSAMKFPPPADPKVPPQILWQTVMYTDDPDHRDLNLVMPTLFAIGAPYFDKHIDREKEKQLYQPPPEGKVNVGTPEVVPEKK